MIESEQTPPAIPEEQQTPWRVQAFHHFGYGTRPLGAGHTVAVIALPNGEELHFIFEVDRAQDFGRQLSAPRVAVPTGRQPHPLSGV